MAKGQLAILGRGGKGNSGHPDSLKLCLYTYNAWLLTSRIDNAYKALICKISLLTQHL